MEGFSIRNAEKKDAALILNFINLLAEYEKLSHEVIATEADIEKYMFGAHSVAEVIFGVYKGEEVGFAIFFHNFSTFLGKPGLYLEDVFIKKEMRGRGFGKQILGFLAKLAIDRGCGRFEWAVLDWNTPSIEFYRSLGAEIKKEWLINRLTGENLKNLAERFGTNESF